MPRPKSRNHRFGGNRATGGNRGLPMPLWVRPGDVVPEVRVHPVHNVGGPDVPKRGCPACGVDVGIKISGELRSHRVGPVGRTWPCPGDHAAPRR